MKKYFLKIEMFVPEINDSYPEESFTESMVFEVFSRKRFDCLVINMAATQKDNLLIYLSSYIEGEDVVFR